MLKRIGLVFAAGTLGGLLNSIFLWAAGRYGLTSLIGVGIHPDWTPAWLYPRLVWGGLWGILFLLPWRRGSVFVRGFLFSLFPTLVMCFYVFPEMKGKGPGGVELGILTPLLVVLANAVWGVTASWYLKKVSSHA